MHLKRDCHGQQCGDVQKEIKEDTVKQPEIKDVCFIAITRTYGILSNGLSAHLKKHKVKYPFVKSV